MTEPQLREILINSCYSDKEADLQIRRTLTDPDFITMLVRVARDEPGYMGDAPMAASFYLTLADPALVRDHEATLLDAFENADGFQDLLAQVLARIQSSRGKLAIQRALETGHISTASYETAMKLFE